MYHTWQMRVFFDSCERTFEVRERTQARALFGLLDWLGAAMPVRIDTCRIAEGARVVEVAA